MTHKLMLAVAVWLAAGCDDERPLVGLDGGRSSDASSDAADAGDAGDAADAD